MTIKTLISTEVRKLGESIPCFILPAVLTCPGATSACKGEPSETGKEGYRKGAICYATRGKIPFHFKRHLANWDASKENNFTDRIIAEINLLISSSAINGSTIRRFRIHPAGDFYSQAYLESWFKIASAFPDIKFLAYTRSYMLDFTGRPDNMKIFFSIDRSTENYPIQKLPIARVICKGDAPTPKAHTCAAKCHSCSVCWHKKIDVDFIKHN